MERSYYKKNRVELLRRKRARIKVRTPEEIEKDRIGKRLSRHRGGFAVLFYNLKKKARQRGMEFKVSREWLQSIYNQSKYSAISGMAFSNETYAGSLTRPFARSVDRIDSNRGYTEDNIRIICWCENQALGEWGLVVFDKMCKARVREILK